MTRPRRIVHVITSLAVGGAQRHLLQLLTDSPEDLQQDVIYFRDHDLRQEIASHAGQVHHIPMTSFWGLALMPQLVRTIAAGKYDIVHTHLLRADMFGAVASRIARVPGLVTTKHNLEERLDRPGWRWLHRGTARLPDLTIGISETVRKWAVTTGGAPASRTRIVHYGIGTQHFSHAARATAREALDLEPETPVVLCPARLDPQKNHALLLRAVGMVRQQLPDTVLLLAGGRQLGSSVYERNLHQLAEILGISKGVRWLGVRGDIDQLLAACDVVAMASEWEGFGLALLEAMSAERAVVATAVGGVPEVVISGETGLLVKTGDTKAFAQALIHLLSDEAERKHLGVEGGRRARKVFTLDAMRASTQAIYDEVLLGRNKGSSNPAPI